MSNTTYVDYTTPTINAAWLNEINDHVWHDTPVVGTTIHTATVIEVTPFDDISSTDVQSALVEINTKIVPPTTIDASDVTYSPAGTGAVITDVQTKLREAVSVKDFGAVGDGITDDTLAIQAAVDYVISQRFATLYFPPNNSAAAYVVTSPIIINNSINIIGAGQRAVTIRGLGFSAGEAIFDFDCATIDTVYHAKLEGITFYSSDSVPNGVRLNNVSYMLMKQVQFYQLTTGIYITGSQTFSNFFEQVTGYSITGNTVKWETFTGGGHYSFKDCTFTGQDGVVFASTAQTDGLVFEACNFEQTITTCAYINGTINGLSFVGCRTEGNNGAQEFQINPAGGKYVHGLTITGCSFLSDTGSSDPIYINGDVKGFNISGNSCWYGGSNQFVNLVSGAGGVISGNYSANSPIIVNAARAGVIIYGNQNSSGALAEYWGNASWEVTEGVFTPTLTFASGSVTLSTATGKYTKIGNAVHYAITLIVSAISTPSGTATIGGFPVTCGAAAPGAVFMYGVAAAATGQAVFTVSASGTTGVYYRVVSGALVAAGSDFIIGSVLQISGTYLT